MSITNGYCTLSDIKGELGINDTNDDARLELAVEAASRAIDDHCRRHFWKDGSDTVRYFTALDYDYLRIDDLASLTTLQSDSGSRTYATTWQATDFDLEPDNASTDNQPYTAIRVAPMGAQTFPLLKKGVKITGKFGWPATPKPVATACKIMAIRLFKRKDAPFGMAGSPESGQMTLPSLDPDVKRLLQPYVRVTLGAI